MFKRLFRAISDCVHQQWAFPALLGLAFIEAIIFIPLGSILTVYCLERPNKALKYAIGAAIASVLGGAVAYGIGCLLLGWVGTDFLAHFSPHGTLHRLIQLYQCYGPYTACAACVTPFPYKLITLSAGFCQLAFFPFLAGIAIGRAVRFIAIALFVRRFGVQMQLIINSYFNYVLVLGVAAFVAMFVVCR